MIEGRIVQLKVQMRKQRDRRTHIRTHTGSYTRSHARTLGRKHARYRRTKKQSFESMPTNEKHDHFHFFVYRKLWTVLLVWASMLWLDWEDIWVSKTFFLVQLVSFFNNTLLCEKKKAEMIIESLYQRGDPSCRCFKGHSRVSTLRCPTRKAFFFLLLFFSFLYFHPLLRRD